MPLILWAAWALLGAFVYAGLRLQVAWKSVTGRSRLAWLTEFVIACTTGPIFGAGFGPIAFSHSGLKGEAEARAFALVVGMIANPIAPVIVKLASGNVIRRLSNLGGEDKK